MTEKPHGTYGNMAHAQRKKLGAYCAWCRKELPDPKPSEVKRFCGDQCRWALEQDEYLRRRPTGASLWWS